MPYVKISPPTGPLNVFYSISTPRNHDAESVIPDVPTILFLHPLYIPQQIFYPQFADHDLRQFNLVALDLRSHGETEGVIGEAVYNPAEDVFHFMATLKLLPCHIFAISIGCSIAMDLASTHPDRVLSLTLCSPQSPTESEEISAARAEIHEDFLQASGRSDPTEISSEYSTLEERLTVVGDYTQYRAGLMAGLKNVTFNNEMDDLALALLESAAVQAQEHWIGSEERIQEGVRAAISWPLHRKALTASQLSKITSPVSIFYFTEDILYPVDDAEALADRLARSGLEVTLHLVSGGPHYGSISKAEFINPVVREFILSCYDDVDDLPCIPFTAESDGIRMKTPFDMILEKYDYQPPEAAEIQVLQFARS
ncbi:Alpha/Beta hydrolase protein [Gymnopilus junonius]|uniref:Alpha/Beta hydrolase protein n=1 Tax=Gymnopilus junonius TaxID=109634 RepID=A0A9P5NVH2_GYMJU|nr:Alpha/Beta hydrolase protein [Gymnopilus junonius]